MNLRNTARMMTSLVAAFLLTPAFSGSLSDSANTELEDAYSNLDRLQNNLVQELVYTAPDAVDVNHDAELVAVYEELAYFGNRAEEMVKYNVPVEDSNTASYSGSHEAYDRISENARTIELTVAYAAPKVDAGFEYHYELAKAVDYIENAGEALGQSLAYHAAAAESGFSYHPALAIAREEIEDQAEISARNLAYQAPNESNGAFSYDFETALLFENINNNAEAISNDISYKAPVAETGFVYSYEMAMAEERLAGFQAAMLEMLQYAAPENLERPLDITGNVTAANATNKAASTYTIEVIRRSPSIAFIKASY